MPLPGQGETEPPQTSHPPAPLCPQLAAFGAVQSVGGAPVADVAPHQVAKGSPLKHGQKEQNISDAGNLNPCLAKG